MPGAPDFAPPRRWTRGTALRIAAVGGAALGAGPLLGRLVAGDVSAAEPSKAMDADILAFFLQLERLQEGFYREAARARGVTGSLLAFVRTVGPQETEHVAFLSERVGRRARPPLRSDFREAMRTPQSVRDAAIVLEEMTLSGYVGQGANLTRDAVAGVARLVSVEARQAAWVRDLSGAVPAPRAADPPRTPTEILDALRETGLVR